MYDVLFAMLEALNVMCDTLHYVLILFVDVWFDTWVQIWGNHVHLLRYGKR